MHYTFQYPYFLILLPLFLCFIYCKKVSQKVYLPKLEWIPKRYRLFDLNTIIKIVIFTLSVVALSRPISYDTVLPSSRYGRGIALALDCSGSMKESGFSKKDETKSKFELLQELLNDFIDKRVSDNIGVVVFGSFAFTASPITYDHESLKEILNMLEVEIAGKNTAIGDAIAQSIVTLKYTQAKNRLIILITDGMNNSGSVSIKNALQKAQKESIKIYTIGIGDKKDYDYQLLKHISQETKAKSFSAKNAHELKRVYEEINKLTPTKIRSEQYLNKKELFIYPLIVVVMLFIFLLARLEGRI